MPPITVHDVRTIILHRRLTQVQYDVGATCQRGTLFTFTLGQDTVSDGVFAQLGCDCAWDPVQEISYEHFVAWLNARPDAANDSTWTTPLWYASVPPLDIRAVS